MRLDKRSEYCLIEIKFQFYFMCCVHIFADHNLRKYFNFNVHLYVFEWNASTLEELLKCDNTTAARCINSKQKYERAHFKYLSFGTFVCTQCIPWKQDGEGILTIWINHCINYTERRQKTLYGLKTIKKNLPFYGPFLSSNYDLMCIKKTLGKNLSLISIILNF